MGSRPSHSTRRLPAASPDAYGNDTHFCMIRRRQAAQAFGAALRSARLDHAISQMTLAIAGDFDPTYVSLLERGRRAPTFLTIVRLAEALQMSPVRLFAGGVAHMRGNAPNGVATLYRCANLLPDGELAEAEAVYPDLETGTSGLDLENLARRADGRHVLTHVVEYVRAGALELTKGR
jgi:transcriptional regulator with XRE-family HTH domain